MRPNPFAVALFALLVASPTPGVPASLLKSTMREWKQQALMLDHAVQAADAPTEAAVSALTALASQARQLAQRSNGSSAAVLDIRARLERFAADAEAAAEIKSRDPLLAQYRRLRGECRACHDLYAN